MSNQILRLSHATHSDIKVPSPGGLSYLPHQLAAIYFLDFVKGNVLIADPPGLGKTIVSIGYANLKHLTQIVITCPASLTGNWAREFEKWTIQKLDIQIYTKSRDELWSKNVIIQSYDLARNGKVRDYVRRNWADRDLLLLDEGHYLKNPKAKRTTSCLAGSGLRPLFKQTVVLTGTPIVNRPIELYPIIKALKPKAINGMTYLSYAFKYCAGFYSEYGLDVSGYSNLKELGHRLRSTFMIRRKKEKVLKDLPALFPPNIVALDPSPAAKKMIKSEEKFSVDKIMEMSGVIVGFEGLSTTRRSLGLEKVKPAVQYLKDQVEARGKVIAFAHHKHVITEIAKEFDSSEIVIIKGDTPSQKRQSLVDRFQNDENCKLFLGSITACGVGITLTASSYVCFVEMSWVPGENQQATDRAHRIGQTRGVVVDYLVFKGSLDENILVAQTMKSEKIKTVMDQKAIQTKETKPMEAKLTKFFLALAVLINEHFGPGKPVEAEVVETGGKKKTTKKAGGKKAGGKKKTARKVAEPEPEIEATAPPTEDFSDFELGVEEETVEESEVTQEMCSDALKAFAAENGRESAIKVLVKHGVKKVSELEDEQLAEFYADLT